MIEEHFRSRTMELIAKATDEELAAIVHRNNDSNLTNLALEELIRRIKPTLQGKSASYGFTGKDIEDAVMDGIDQNLPHLCTKYATRPAEYAKVPFRSYVLSYMQAEFHHYRRNNHVIRRSHRFDEEWNTTHRYAESCDYMDRDDLISHIEGETGMTKSHITWLLSLPSKSAVNTVCSAEEGDLEGSLGKIDAVEANLMIQQINEDLENILDPIEKFVFTRFIGLLDEDPMTREELLVLVASKFNKQYRSKSSITNIYRRAVAKLKEYYVPEDFYN